MYENAWFSQKQCLQLGRRWVLQPESKKKPVHVVETH